jgi:hypothetical protein
MSDKSRQVIKVTPGDELHLTMLMAPMSLNLVTGGDRQALLAYARSVWQASRKQALTEYESKLTAELNHAAINDHRMTPPFGRVLGEPAVRSGNIEAVIEFMMGKNEDH